MLSILAKVREIAEFWKGKLDVFYEETGEMYQPKDYLNDRIKMMIGVNLDWNREEEIHELEEFLSENLSIYDDKDIPDMIGDPQSVFLAMNTEINLFTVRHIRKIKRLVDLLKLDNLTYDQLEHFLDGTYDHFITIYDWISRDIRAVNSNKSLAEILADEKEAQDRYYAGLHSYANVINVHKHAEDRIREYLDERCFPAGSTTREDILAILDEMDAEVNAEKDAKQ